MASAKKKPSAKRTVKYAAKTQSTSARTSTNATHAGSDWMKNSSSDWQKGASEWAKQSAKMYQFPLDQNSAEDAAKTAAATMKNATESMMKMSTDMMQKMFGQTSTPSFNAEAFNPATMFKNMPQMPKMEMPTMPQMPGFDAAAMQEKMSHFTRESAEQMAKSSSNATHAMNEAMALSRENLQVLMDVTNIAVTVSKQLGAESVSYMNKLFAQNTDLSKQVLSCRTLNDMFDLASRVMKTNLDSFFSESVKMSEMLFQCATDVSEPLNDRVSETTERMTKAMAA